MGTQGKKLGDRGSRQEGSPLGDLVGHLLLLRHADREMGQGARADSGLTPWGHEQAQRVAQALKQALDSEFRTEVSENQRISMWSSPKLRCQQTLAPLAAELGVPPKICPFLDEGGALSTKWTSFLAEILGDWTKLREEVGPKVRPLLVACTHGDVAPYFLEAALGKQIHLEKAGGAWLRLEVRSSGPVAFDLVRMEKAGH
jgi:phosphohistidine phosphatase SixA